MNWLRGWWILSLTLTGVVGCAGSTIRYPVWPTGDNINERRAAEFHDPYPDSDAGPSVSLRPRELQVQRSEPRRIRETSLRSQAYNGGGLSSPSPTDAPNSYQVVPP